MPAKKRNTIHFILFVAVLGLLVVTNPSMDDYQNHMRSYIIKESQRIFQYPDAKQSTETKSIMIASILAGDPGTAAASLTAQTTRTDYVFFSIYDCELLNERIKMLGILKNFIDLSFENPVQDEYKQGQAEESQPPQETPSAAPATAPPPSITETYKVPMPSPSIHPEEKEADSTRLIKVYSNKNNNYYIPEHIVKSNLESGHAQNGNLHVLLYEDFNEVMRQGVIRNIERGVGNGSIVPSKNSPSNPNLVKYQVLDLTLDQNTKVVSLKETIFIDKDGSTIATQTADEAFPLDSKKYQTLSNAIHGAIGVLEKAKNGQDINYQPPGNENKAPIRQEEPRTRPTAEHVIQDLRNRDPSKSVAEKQVAPAQQPKREIMPPEQDAQSVRQDYQAQLAQMETFIQHTLDSLTLPYDATIKIYPQGNNFFEYRIYVEVPSNVFDSLYIPPRRTLSEFIRISPRAALVLISEGKRYFHVLAYAVVKGSKDNSHYKPIGDCVYMYPSERMRCSDTMTVSNYEIPIF
jgi:hypothetical protein